MFKQPKSHSPSQAAYGSASVFLSFCALFLALVVVLPTGASAQESVAANGPAPGSTIQIVLPKELDAGDRAALVEALQESGLPIAELETAPPPGTVQPSTNLLDQFFSVVGETVFIPRVFGNWWVSLADTTSGQLLAFAGLVLGVALGVAAAWYTRRLSQPWLSRMRPHVGEPFTRRLGRSLAAYLIDLLAMAVFAGVVVAIGGLLLPASAIASLAQVTATGSGIIALLALRNLLFSPYRAQLRLIDLPDAEAQRLGFWSSVGILFYGLVVGLQELLMTPVVQSAGERPLAVIVTLISLAIEALVVWKLRLVIGELIRRTYIAKDEVGRAVGLAADTWFIPYLLIVLALGAYRTLALIQGDNPSLLSPFGDAVTLIVIMPFVVGAFSNVTSDLFGLERDDTPIRRRAFGKATVSFGEGLLVIMLLALAIGILGINPFDAGAGVASTIAFAVLQASAAVVLGWSVWRGLKKLLDSYDEPATTVAFGDEGAGAGGSRLQTLIPLVRSALLVTVVITSTLMALSALGIDIAPLLAGAGVVGLAIGFGAQALVRDIISGVFFLVEDAFRKGEYIITEAGKGVVEEISLRSLRLRHHRGPLYTIPFGQIGTIQNHSRDWVKIKFLLHVPLDSDLEKVRKTIKNVGLRLLEDPEIGTQFLAPLKWQGVLDIAGGAFVIGVKFISKPGEQFLIRRKAYQELQRSFAEAGLEFATPKVTVAPVDNPAMSPLAAVGASQTLQVKEA